MRLMFIYDLRGRPPPHGSSIRQNLATEQGPGGLVELYFGFNGRALRRTVTPQSQAVRVPGYFVRKPDPTQYVIDCVYPTLRDRLDVHEQQVHNDQTSPSQTASRTPDFAPEVRRDDPESIKRWHR